MTGRRVAIVTGGGKGIGRSSALALVRKGYSVVIAGRDEGSLAETKALCQGPGEILVVVTDVTDQLSVQSLFNETKRAYSRLDLLFNNAGIGAASKALEDLSLEEWNKVVNTNLTGSFLCTQEAFKMMKSQKPRGGRIINNGSVSAHAPRPHSAPYTSTKHAITGLTKSTSLDGREYDIACGQIDIGNAETALTAKMSAGIIQANGLVEKEPVFDVEHVSDALLYMAGLPLDVNVQFITVMATKMPFVGRG